MTLRNTHTENKTTQIILESSSGRSQAYKSES